MADIKQAGPDAGLRIAAVLSWLRRHAFELFIVLLILHICLSRGLSFKVNVHDPQSGLPAATYELSASRTANQAGILPVFGLITNWFNTKISFRGGVDEEGTSAGLATLAAAGPSAGDAGVNSAFTRSVGEATTAQNVSLLGVVGASTTAVASPAAVEAGLDHFNSVSQTDDPAPHINNLTLVLSPSYFSRHDIPTHIVQGKRRRLQAYLDTYAPLAQAEMREHGIPASITLAQALLESNAGDSRLATQSNNHFGIKCKSRCLGCTCRNYGDDTRYDMFRVFDSVAESFEEHSALLLGSRYERLFGYGQDYVRWAHGLKTCGYATDPNYGHKLIKIIEGLNLNEYDDLAVAAR